MLTMVSEFASFSVGPRSSPNQLPYFYPHLFVFGKSGFFGGDGSENTMNLKLCPVPKDANDGTLVITRLSLHNLARKFA
jgi:hypothetical protein